MAKAKRIRKRFTLTTFAAIIRTRHTDSQPLNGTPAAMAMASSVMDLPADELYRKLQLEKMETDRFRNMLLERENQLRLEQICLSLVETFELEPRRESHMFRCGAPRQDVHG